MLFDYTGRHAHRWGQIFPYTRTVLIAFGLVLLSVAMAVPLVATYIANDLALSPSYTNTSALDWTVGNASLKVAFPATIRGAIA